MTAASAASGSPSTVARAHLSSLIDTKNVLLCVGCGGVGKTTTSAALALEAARRGRRVLCLTIDPAKRLANSLGLQAMTSEEQRIDPSIFAAADLVVQGSLTVMMLDTKKTFDELVTRHASSNAARDAILGNKLYQYVSTSLAGTQEYMAMEKLEALRRDARFDLIVVDTPPTANALDFLDAPERMIEAIDSPAMRWFVQAFTGKGSGRGLGLLGRGSQLALKGVAAITGAAFLDQLAGFIAAMNDLFGGFTERARKVGAVLRGPEIAFVLVTSPDPLAIDEINFFADRLAEASMPRDIFVVNRVHVAPAAVANDKTLDAELATSGLAVDASLIERVGRAHADAAALATRDRSSVNALRTQHGNNAATPIVEVPAFDTDVHDVAALARVGASLAHT